MNRLKHKIAHISNQERRAQTRTKIQLGGLVVKSNLADLVGIEIGEDLQLDMTKWDQASLLLGLLMKAFESAKSLTDSQKQDLIHKGMLALKYEFFPES
jgi:hypothetical protein